MAAPPLKGKPSNTSEVAACPEQLAVVLFMVSHPQIPQTHTSPCSTSGSHALVYSPLEPNATSHTGPLPNSMESSHIVLATLISSGKLISLFLNFSVTLPVMDIHSLVNFLCMLVCIHGFMACSSVQPAQVFQILYVFTMGPLSLINACTISSQQLTLDYQQILFTFFIGPSVMLPLLQVRYFHSQWPGKVLSEK
jgi:hypothetical protein